MAILISLGLANSLHRQS